MKQTQITYSCHVSTFSFTGTLTGALLIMSVCVLIFCNGSHDNAELVPTTAYLDAPTPGIHMKVVYGNT